MRKVYISEHAEDVLKEYLISRGYELSLVKETGLVSKPVSSHPDIYMCRLKNEVFFGDRSKLVPEYPGDVLYNAAVLGDYIICSKYTDPELISRSGCKQILVKQGYVKCNLVVLSDHHVITEDEGIYKALGAYSDINCLLISPRQVRLPGHEYGFIGGASGLVDGEIIFNGDLSRHSDYKAIADFVSVAGVGIKYFPDYPLCDIGSIILE